MKLLLVGMNHRSAPLALRERFATDDVGAALGPLVASGEIEEAVMVSTCNRVEVLAAAPRPEPASLRLRAFFQRELLRGGAVSQTDLDAALYERRDAEAVRHLFRVASSIDSMVIGEPQILGQVKDAYRAAVTSGACGPILNRLYQQAFATAKRVRNETRIAERAVSVARVAVQLATEIFEELGDKSALLVGAGEMTELALESLRSRGLAKVRVVNRTPGRAAELARHFEASAHGLSELRDLLPLSDVVLTSIGGSAPLLTVEVVAAALRARRNRAIFLIDIGVPRNVEPAVNDLDNVYLYDIDDLALVAQSNAEERRRETARAEAIVLEEEQRFDGWLAALSAVPTIRDLRQRAERVRARELDRVLSRLQLDENQRAGVEALTRGIVNKLLHAPVARLRKEGNRQRALAMLEAVRALFALDAEIEPNADAEDEADSEESAPVSRAAGEP